MNDSLTSIASAFEALLEVPALAAHLRRNVELLDRICHPQEEEPLPAGTRTGLRKVAAALALAPSLPDLVRFADQIDFRDLNEVEVAYLEGVAVKTVQRWRMDGTGPDYRCEAGISYPIRWLWTWRERGRQRLTSQKKTRGRDLATR